MDLKVKSPVLITCAKGLMPYLKQELEALGYWVGSSHETGVVVEATLYDAMKLNLYLRTAYNILYLIKEFSCSSSDGLYDEASMAAWEDIIVPGEYLSVVSRTDTSSIRNSMFASQRLKDAIVDRIMKRTGKRPDAGPERNNVVVNLYWKDDRAWIYLNTSGKKLSDRGYRRMPHKAPMQETLAAGVIMATGFDAGKNLINPMCGSGTLAIEAALLGTGRTPGLLRSNYGIMHVKDFDNDAWQALRKEALRSGKKSLTGKIIATDRDPAAVRAAQKNAMTAGVDHLIEFGVSDFADTRIPEGQGIVLVNPEYGMRMGEISELEKTYESIGDFFKQKCAGYTAYIFTGNLELAKKVGLRTSQRIPFFNGDIECRLLKYEIYK